MGEKATQISDAASGDFIATRDAKSNDELANPRVIQLVDQANRHHGLTGTPTRAAFLTDSNTVEVTFAGGQLLTVGDESLLVVHLNSGIATPPTITVTPIIVDSGNNVIGVLKPVTLTATPIASGEGVVRYPVASWDIAGADFIRVHCNWAGGGANDMWAGLCSGRPNAI